MILSYLARDIRVEQNVARVTMDTSGRIYMADTGLEIKNNLRNTFIHFHLKETSSVNDDFNITYNTYPTILTIIGKKTPIVGKKIIFTGKRKKRRGARGKNGKNNVVHEMTMQEFEKVLQEDKEIHKSQECITCVHPETTTLNINTWNAKFCEDGIINELRTFMNENNKMRVMGCSKLYTAGGLYLYCNLIKRALNGELDMLFCTNEHYTYMEKIQRIWRTVHLLI